MAEEQEMGHLVLVLGDFHVPQRCTDVPNRYKEMITPNKVNAVICTGNLGNREMLDWVKSLSPNLHIVKGDYEDSSQTELPEQKVVDVFGVKMGLIHGHQIIPWGEEEMLENKAKQMGVKYLVMGHNHKMGISKHNGVHFINPGSMTGAYNVQAINSPPSFIILELRTAQIIAYEYSLVNEELNCVDSKIEKQ